MNKIFVALAALALFNVHVARGDADSCKATVDGKETVLKNGDRFCADDTTSKTCTGNDQFTEDKCPPGSKCLKSPGSFATLCREVRRNGDNNQGPEPAPQPQPQPDKGSAPQPKPQEPRKEEPAPSQSGKQADQGAPSQKAAPEKETCTSEKGTFNSGERYCKSETTTRVCSYGEWFDFDCPANSKCLEGPNKQVLCREIRRNAQSPSGPQSQKQKRSASDKPVKKDDNQVDQPAPAQAAPEKQTCTSEKGTFQSGERYCKSETTSRVCSYGEWFDFDCPANSKCLEGPNKQVLCREIRRNPPSANGPDSQRQRRAANDTAPTQNAPTAPEKETCTSEKGTFNSGERYCKDDKTSRVCSYGEWFDFDCPANSKCLEGGNKQVLCREIRKNPPSSNGPESPRQKRGANDTAPAQNAPAAPEKPETCTSEKGTFQTGERYCKSETTSRVCSYGEWFDFDCPPNSKCMEGNKEGRRQVLCRELKKNAPWPTGPQDKESPKHKRSPQEKPNPQQPKPIAPEPALPPRQPRDCGNMKTGDQVCVGDGYKMCYDGDFIQDNCPRNSKCLQSATENRVLCREVRKNAVTDDKGSQRQ